MLVYVNDVIHLEKDSHEDMLKLKLVYLLKEGFGSTDRYFGANVDKYQLEDKRTVCYMNCIAYLRGDIKNVDQMLEGNKAALKSFGDVYHTYPSSYRK